MTVMESRNLAAERSRTSFANRYPLALFFIVTLTSSAVIAAVAARIGNTNLSILTVFAPSLAAIVLTALADGRPGLYDLLVTRTFRVFRLRWLVAAVMLIPLLGMVAVGVHSLAGGPDLALRTTQLLPQVIVIILIALGEEYGWRGYALPRLQERHNALTAGLILGLLWGIWHLPAYLIGTGVPQDMPFPVFLLWVVGGTLLISWVYNNTGSVMTAIVMHMTANASFNYLPLLPEFTGQLTTFWLFLGLVWLAAIGVVIRFGAARLVRHGPSAAPALS